MKIIYIIVFFSFYLSVSSQKKMTPEEYIASFKEHAITEMYIRKVPACITLAQGLLESGFGNSELCVNANNHFGIKCHLEWLGEIYIMDDDSSNECFRKYESVVDSYRDHSLFLCSRPRYSFLFQLPTHDYIGWCNGLKSAGYATDPRYTERLIELIEKYKLHELNIPENTPKQDFPLHGEIKSEMVIKNVYRFNHIRFVIAKDNDTYFKIAQRYNLKLEQLLDFNDLVEIEKLNYGQKVYIEKKRRRALEPYHVVQKNETLKSISQLHGIRLNMLCKKNKLDSSAKLKVGDVLYLRQRKKLSK